MTLAAKSPENLTSIWGYTRARRLQAGLCTGCGGEVEGDVRRTASGVKKRMCRACLKKNPERMSKFRIEKEAAGLCTRCGKSPHRFNRRTCESCSVYCSEHSKQRIKKTFFERKARNGADMKFSILQAKMLWSLWKEQRGRCALTGVRLNRENSELDHITPRSKGGGNERSNLRWLNKDVNQAKRSLTDSEFILMCKAVVNYSESTNVL
jgi:hypothetical protein